MATDDKAKKPPKKTSAKSRYQPTSGKASDKPPEKPRVRVPAGSDKPTEKPVEKPRVRAQAGSGRGGAVVPYKAPGVPSTTGGGGSGKPPTGSSGTSLTASNGPRVPATAGRTGGALARAGEALAGAARSPLGKLGRYIPGVGAAIGAIGGLTMLADTYKDVKEQETARATKDKEDTDAAQRRSASFPRGNPAGRSKMPKPEAGTTPTKKSATPAKKPAMDKPMTDEEILAWNNRRKAARGEKLLDKSVLARASYKRK